jgi:hypothetical protein
VTSPEPGSNSYAARRRRRCVADFEVPLPGDGLPAGRLSTRWTTGPESCQRSIGPPLIEHGVSKVSPRPRWTSVNSAGKSAGFGGGLL